MKLKEITSLIAERANRAFDTPFQKELEEMVHYWRAEMVRQALTKRPYDRRFFVQSIQVEVVPAEDSECEDLECHVGKTELAIPSPLMANGILFDYVGSTDRTNSFGYASPAKIETLPYNRYTKNGTFYMYRNGYIYTLNAKDVGKITIEAIFEDPTELSKFKCGTGKCYDEDSEYPMPGSITKAVVNSILTNELRLVGQEEKEINVTE